jgi:hypothetical protein
MKNWQRGRTLITSQTKQWSSEQIHMNDIVEKSMIFSDFSLSDLGRGRQLVCTMNMNHDDYEENVKRIINSSRVITNIKTLLYLYKIEYGRLNLDRKEEIDKNGSEFHIANLTAKISYVLKFISELDEILKN